MVKKEVYPNSANSSSSIIFNLEEDEFALAQASKIC